MRKWDGIEAFIAVVRHGSFTAAAEALNVSASHISRCVSELEAQLATPLIYRTTRRIRLSEAGESYFSQCQALLDGFVSAENNLRAHQHEPSGQLKISCATTFGERFIVPLLPEFLRTYPKLSLDLHLSNERVDLIRDGFDLAIRLGTMADSTMLARRLCDRQEYVCASAEYIARFGEPQSLADLSQHNCLLGTKSTWAFLDNGARKDLRVEGSWRCNSGPALLEAVRSGLGLAQLPDYYVAPFLKRGDLVSVLDRYRYPLSGVWLVYPKARQQLPRLKLLCDYLIEHIATQKINNC